MDPDITLIKAPLLLCSWPLLFVASQGTSILLLLFQKYLFLFIWLLQVLAVACNS